MSLSIRKYLKVWNQPYVIFGGLEEKENGNKYKLIS